jgi:hypothetical protein
MFSLKDAMASSLGYLHKTHAIKTLETAVLRILQPATGIDQVHTRSTSQFTVVSIPFKNPRILWGAFKGINSIRFSYRRTCTFAPGLIDKDSLTSRGMTTWNFGETVTAFMKTSFDTDFVAHYHDR